MEHANRMFQVSVYNIEVNCVPLDAFQCASMGVVPSTNGRHTEWWSYHASAIAGMHAHMGGMHKYIQHDVLMVSRQFNAVSARCEGI